jgi:DNA polymerase-3 subunit alpha
VKAEKNIALVVPGKDVDLSWFFEQMEIDPHEVAVTWPKDSVDLVEEISAMMPKLVIQVGERYSRRYPFWDEGTADALKQRIDNAIADDFVVLHHHDEYSLKDGLGTVDQLAKVLKRQRRSFCCVTNHGSVGGWIKQNNACMKAGIKPIFGMEAYVSNYRGDDPELKKAHRSANQLILLAKNETGFYNIIQIHNDAQLNGFYYSPRMDHGAAKKWGEGVIGTSACMAGEIPQALMEDDFDRAKEIYDHYNECFDEFYIELQIIEFEMQRDVNRKLIDFARKVNAPVILACDSHYLDPTHADTHDLLMYIRQGKTKLDAVEKDEDVWDFECRNLFYRDARQMEEVFRGGFVTKDKETMPEFLDDVFTEEVFKEAMGNTLRVARKIENIKLDSTVKLPKLYKDSETILREKVNAGFRALGLNKRPNKEEYVERLRYEFGVITKLGWADYFLVMEKIVNMAKQDFYDEVGEWAIGYGRGSAAGCLISWCLGLTDCDPMEHGLLFERFLDEGRPDPPDIDTDFHPGIRQRVKDRIVEMFGEEKTCSIGTYTTYKTKAVIIDVARALGYDVFEAQSVTKEMDSLKSFETDDGSEIVDKMDFDELCKHYPQLDDYFDKYPDIQIHASIIRNQVRNMGKHAGGVIISDMDLTGKIPVQYESSGDRSIISSWAESGSTAELSQVGLVKYDILGLNNLPIIADCVRLIKENRGIEIKRSELPLDDKKTIRMEAKGDLKGIFQFENPGTKPIVEAVGVESLNDVSAVTSLLRPGPKDMGMHLEYAERKNGKPYDVLPCLDWIFKDTYGILVYQEQMMQIAQELCGFDGPMSNKLRKACGKKLKDLMVSIKQKFIEGAQPRIDAGEVSLEEVEELWDLIVAFARYGFNKSHAVTYSMITTAELWLKHNYFLEYMTALVQNTKRGKQKHGSSDIMADYLNYARKKSVDVLAPDINAGCPDFHIFNGRSIRYGLAHVKNVASAADNISKIAAAQPFTDMADFYERCVYKSEIKSGANAGNMRETRPTNKHVESLVHAGAFDSFGDRNTVLTEYSIARLGIPRPSDEEIEEYRVNILKPGEECPDINSANADFTVVKGVGQVGEHITAVAMNEPYQSMADFYERCMYETEIKSGRNAGEMKVTRPTKKVVENLIYAGAFKGFGDERKMLREYHLAKNKLKPVNFSDDELELLEIEMIGMCLSREPLCKVYHDLIVDQGWSTIGSCRKSKKSVVFGRVEMIEPKNSRAGNPMYIVRLSDGLDKMDFFVFKGGMDYFRDSVRKGQLAAIPLSGFDDGGPSRFFDDRREISIIDED